LGKTPISLFGLDENEGLNLVAVASFALEQIGIRKGRAKKFLAVAFQR
jgi:hypothetical protein